MSDKPVLIVLGGATASGKTSLAIQIAQNLDAEVINGDSRQFYREMKIGNARPSPGELRATPHHFVADRSVTEPLSAGRFAAEALAMFRERFLHRKYTVLVGGSGLYLRALSEGLNEFPTVTEEARTQVENRWVSAGLDGYRELLQQLDPDYLASVDQQNPRRLQRALEVSLSAGAPYSSFLGKRVPRPFNSLYLRTDVPRTLLYERINQRVDAMVAEGLEGEARSLIPYQSLATLQTVGYQEWWPYFTGERSIEEVIELIKRNSRRYAKRQGTWFRKGDQYHPVSDAEGALAYIEGYC